MNELKMQEWVEEIDYATVMQAPNSAVYCSFNPQTDDQRVTLYKAMSAPEKRISECLNMELKIKDIFCETVVCKDEVGRETKCPRVVLIDEKGIGYQAVSHGVYNSVRRLITVFGLPTWDKPLTIIPKGIKKGVNTIVTLDLKG